MAQLYVCKYHQGSDPVSSCSKIIDIGSYDELIERGHDLRTITHPKVSSNDGEESFIPNEGETENIIVNTFTEPLPPPPPPSLSHKIDNSTILRSDCHADPDCKVSLEEDPVLLSEHTYPKSIEPIQATQTQQRQLSTDDTMLTGSVPLKTYLTYLKSIKNPLLLVVAFASYWASNGMQVSHSLLLSTFAGALV